MLTRWQSTIVDAQGNIQPFAILTILNEETQSPAQIYASESESQPLPDGTVVADESGYAYFYARGGRYRIQAADLSIDWRHVPLGNLSAMDESDLGLGSAATLDVATTEQAEDLVADDTLITPQRLGDSMNSHVLGMGQAWQNVTESRSLGTTYTNTTGRTIAVAASIDIETSASWIYGRVDGANIAMNSTQTGTGSELALGVLFLVGPGSTYQVQALGGLALRHWMELR